MAEIIEYLCSQEHIDAAIVWADKMHANGLQECCPVAQALKEKFETNNVRVGLSHVEIDKQLYKFDDKTYDIICSYGTRDMFKHMHPFIIRMEECKNRGRLLSFN